MWEIVKDGDIYLRERVRDPMTGKSRTVSVKVTKNTASGKKEAMTRLMEKVRDKSPKRLKLSDLIRFYEEEHVRAVRKSTFTRDHVALNTVLKITDDIYVDQMTAGYIRRKMIESGKPNSSLNELIKRLKTFLMWAYRNDFVDREIADKLTPFADRTKKEKIADKFLERDELQLLIDSFDIDRWKLLTEFLALSGLRIGEAVALNDEDVDDKYIHVTKTYNGNLNLLGEAKTRSSARDVYIQPELNQENDNRSLDKVTLL